MEILVILFLVIRLVAFFTKKDAQTRQALEKQKPPTSVVLGKHKKSFEDFVHELEKEADPFAEALEAGKTNTATVPTQVVEVQQVEPKKAVQFAKMEPVNKQNQQSIMEPSFEGVEMDGPYAEGNGYTSSSTEGRSLEGTIHFAPAVPGEPAQVRAGQTVMPVWSKNEIVKAYIMSEVLRPYHHE
ncbi:MAG: hypothetical protein SPL05_03735 [Eubacteriales bacterium]|nr:hypothetical protein [Eubacteriales bacterium]